MRMLDVGLIGYGLGGRRFHAPVIAAVEGLRLAAVVQRNAETAKEDFPGVHVVRSVEELLAINSIRLTVIATPNSSHYPLAKHCLESGRDVIVDKPFTNSVAEASELLSLARRLGRVLTVYHNRRFDADFQALRCVVASGELGRVLRFENTYDRFRPEPKPGAWREQPGPGSGVLFDLGPHLIDQALVLLGKPDFVWADVRTERKGIVTDDAFDVLLGYRGGVRALLRATMLGAAARPRFAVLGTRACYRKQGFDLLEPSLREGKVPQGEDWMLEQEENWAEIVRVDSSSSERRKVASRGDWREFYANVRDAIVRNAPLLVTPRQVMDVMAGLELAQESSAKRAAVAWRNMDF